MLIYVQFELNLWINRMTIMCPVPRTNEINTDSSLNPYNFYNEDQETSAYQLSKVYPDATSYDFFFTS